MMHGVLRAAASCGSLVVDTGLDTGFGNAGIGQHHSKALQVYTLGVSPSEVEEGLSNHRREHLVFTDCQGWSDDTMRQMYVRRKFLLLRKLAGTQRVVVIAAGSSPSFKEELIEASKQRYPILLLQGSGGLTDALIVAAAGGADSCQEPSFRAVLESGQVLRPFSIQSPAAPLAQLLRVFHLVDMTAIHDRSAFWWKEGQDVPPDEEDDTVLGGDGDGAGEDEDDDGW